MKFICILDKSKFFLISTMHTTDLGRMRGFSLYHMTNSHDIHVDEDAIQLLAHCELLEK